MNLGGGTPGRNRTCDLPLRRRALYPLSYWGVADADGCVGVDYTVVAATPRAAWGIAAHGQDASDDDASAPGA